MRKLIGDYFLGIENVEIYVDAATTDGHAQLPGDWYHQGKVRVGSLTIGLAGSYSDAVGVLLHEAFEYSTVRLQLRYQADLRASQSPSIGLFVFNHDQFSELTDVVGNLMAAALPALHKAYLKYHKSPHK
jgi:hypothetical protein